MNEQNKIFQLYKCQYYTFITDGANSSILKFINKCTQSSNQYDVKLYVEFRIKVYDMKENIQLLCFDIQIGLLEFLKNYITIF